MPACHPPEDDASFREEVRAGLAELDRGQSVDHEEVKRRLRAAIAQGDASADAMPGVFERLRAKCGLR
jgi:hypothetical protein